MTRALGILAQAFLVVAVVSWLGWIYTRFMGPIAKVSYEGFLNLTFTCLAFAAVSALCLMALSRSESPRG